MCGRFTRLKTWAELVSLYRLTGADADPFVPPPLPPSWNVAPTDAVAVLRRPTPRETAAAPPGERRLALRVARWGLIPSWAKTAEAGARTINARAETVDRLPSFRSAFRRRRCLIPADGFYEWQALAGRRKQPWYITLADPQPFAFAGLWELWRDPAAAPGGSSGSDAAGGGWIESCTIIVTAASPFLAPLHQRMPVIVTADQFEAWLDLDRPLPEALAMLRSYPGRLTIWPVETRVNSVRINDAGCAQPMGDAISGPADQPAVLQPVPGAAAGAVARTARAAADLFDR